MNCLHCSAKVTGGPCHHDRRIEVETQPNISQPTYEIGTCRNTAHGNIIRVTADDILCGRAPIKCPKGHGYRYASVKGTASAKPCDISCMGARSNVCICSCRGMNHGSKHGVN